MWDEITYPFPDFNSCTVEVWEGISNFTPHFTGHVITYSWQRTKNGCHNRTISSSSPRSNCWCWKPFISYDVTCKEQMIYYNINFYNIHIITCSWLSEIFYRQFQNHTGLQYASAGKQTRSKSKLKWDKKPVSISMPTREYMSMELQTGLDYILKDMTQDYFCFVLFFDIRKMYTHYCDE